MVGKIWRGAGSGQAGVASGQLDNGLLQRGLERVTICQEILGQVLPNGYEPPALSSIGFQLWSSRLGLLQHFLGQVVQL
eukprot:3539893-Lingulodinium_polyedra.AAC.1